MRALLCCLLLAGSLRAAPARAAFEEEQKALDALVAQRKFASAARYLEERPALEEQPRFLRQLTHLLTTSYLVTFNYRMFGLRDLAEGDDLRQLRGKPGTYQLLGGDLEKRLHQALARWPEDPDIQLAVGEYLSRGKDCGCHQPELFQGAAAWPSTTPTPGRSASTSRTSPRPA